MCGRLRTASREFTPGTPLYFNKHGKPSIGLWGLAGGQIYNARYEKLDGFWRPLMEQGNRGIIEVEGFYDGGQLFEADEKLHLGVVYNNLEEFAIVTVGSKGLIATVHHRMPLILTDDNLWMDKGLIKEYNIEHIKVAA